MLQKDNTDNHEIEPNSLKKYNIYFLFNQVIFTSYVLYSSIKPISSMYLQSVLNNLSYHGIGSTLSQTYLNVTKLPDFGS
jgi:hypothetical protein